MISPALPPQAATLSPTRRTAHYSITRATHTTTTGRWKLLEYGELFDGLQPHGQWPPQLFDVEADPHEARNLAHNHPALLTSLRQQLHDSSLDCAAADAAAKRHDHELFEAQECTGLNGTRACFAAPLGHADLHRVHAWRVAAARAFGSTPPPAGALEVGGMLAPPSLRDGPVLFKRV